MSTEGRRVVQLPEALANQIAAGEVVARPASVVKELVENAVDAGATSVRVEADGGGALRICVVDDGSGMHPEDAVLALARHATSKIRSADDLQALTTLGFRGEALPSIASVSRFVLQTRRREDEAGTQVTVTGGASPVVEPCGCAPGTRVEVADLFFNVPARKKFLRATATESAHVGEVVRMLALAHPELSVELVRDRRRSQRYLRMPGRAERVRDVLSEYPLREVAGERGPLRVEAFLSPPDRARSGAAGLAIFVNGRPVQDRALARAVAAAHGDALERGRFPVGAVFVEVPPALVDVNVHPQKAEVRFAHARAVTDAVYSVVSSMLAPSAARAPAPTRPAGATAPPWRGRAAAETPERWRWADSGALPSPPATEAPSLAPPAPSPTSSGLRLLGVVRERLLVCEGSDALVVVDRVAARARELARRAEAELSEGRLVSQRLLFPVVREVDAAMMARLESADFPRLGFDVRPSGERRVTLHAVPRLFKLADPERLLDELLGAGAKDELVDRCAALASEAEPHSDEAVAAALAEAARDDGLAVGRLDLARLLAEARR